MSEHDFSPASTPDRRDRIIGCLVGLAVGDALGAPLEFLSRREVRKRYPEGLRDMIDSRLWKKGEYTDDTQMTVVIAESLLQRKGFLASDLAQRFQTWARTAKDVGIQTRAVVNMAGYVHDPEGCSSRYHAAHPESSAGAYYGYSALPGRWRDELQDEARIRLLGVASQRFRGRQLPATKGAAEQLIDELEQKRKISPPEKVELRGVWETRNAAVHPGGSPP